MVEEYYAVRHKVMNERILLFKREQKPGLLLELEVGGQFQEDFQKNPQLYEFTSLPLERIEALVKWGAQERRTP